MLVLYCQRYNLQLGITILLFYSSYFNVSSSILMSCLVLSTLAWARTRQTTSHEMRNSQVSVMPTARLHKTASLNSNWSIGPRPTFHRRTPLLSQTASSLLCRTHGGTWWVYEPDITGRIDIWYEITEIKSLHFVSRKHTLNFISIYLLRLFFKLFILAGSDGRLMSRPLILYLHDLFISWCQMPFLTPRYMNVQFGGSSYNKATSDNLYSKTTLDVSCIIIELTSCLVLSTLAWVRTCQTISHEMRNCNLSELGLLLAYTKLSVWTLIEA